MPAFFQPPYRFFTHTKVLLIAAVAAFVAAMNDDATTAADLTWSYGLLVFAALEQVNYHLRRNGRLRKAALGLGLKP